MCITLALLCLVAVSAVVSFVVGAFVRNRFVAVTGSVVIVELLFLLFTYHAVASSSDAPEIVNVPWMLAIVIAPAVLAASSISVALACRFRKRMKVPFE